MKYPFKIWLTSVLLGPIFLVFRFKHTISSIIDYIFSTDFLQFYFVSVIIGGCFSIPCFLFLWLCYRRLVKKETPIWLLKVTLLLLCLLCCITIFILISLPNLTNFWSKGNIFLIGSYCLPLLAGVFIYRVNDVDCET